MTPIETAQYCEIVISNQDLWRRNKQGLFSRPQEIPFLPQAIDTSIKSTFRDYINPRIPPPVIAWSVLWDQTPINDAHWVIPTEMVDQEEAYGRGIKDLTEWAVGYTTRYYTKVAWSGNILSRLLYKMPDLGRNITYSAGPHSIEASQLMKTVKVKSQAEDEEFDDAIFSALLRHEPDSLNRIISSAEISGCQNIDELAVLLGKKRTAYSDLSESVHSEEKPNAGFFNKLERKLLTLNLGGTNRTGLVNIYAGFIAVPLPFVSLTTLLYKPELSSVLFPSIAYCLIMGSFLPENLIHESVHHYAEDLEHQGFVKVRRSEA